MNGRGKKYFQNMKHLWTKPEGAVQIFLWVSWFYYKRNLLPVSSVKKPRNYFWFLVVLTQSSEFFMTMLMNCGVTKEIMWEECIMLNLYSHSRCYHQFLFLWLYVCVIRRAYRVVGIWSALKETWSSLNLVFGLIWVKSSLGALCRVTLFSFLGWVV